MRIKTMFAMLLVAAIVTGAAGPASAKRPIVEQVGRGTWATATTGEGVTFTGTTTGLPMDGDTEGSLGPADGTLPPWPGCEPGTGTITTTSGRETLTVALTGNLCRSVSPAGYLVFIGWYDVVSYTGRGNRVADGRGSVDLRVLTDGSAQWMLLGDLY